MATIHDGRRQYSWRTCSIICTLKRRGCAGTRWAVKWRSIVALANPQKVAGLILIDSAGVEVPGRGTLAPGYLLIPVVGRILIALSLASDKLVRQGLEQEFL